MLYAFLKIAVRLSMLIFCRKVRVNRPELLREKGPLLLACNHPNSFLDSVLIDALFEPPVWSLARGDAFMNKPISRLLGAFRILPVYRTSEGVENLSENYKTFEACIEIFKKNGVVHIFSEGRCINEWHLRPLKKGTARLAIKSWEENIPLRVLPVGINYSSFRRLGKNVFIHFGEMITRDSIDWTSADGIRHQLFNTQLQQQLEKGVFEIDKNDKKKQAEMLEIKPSLLQQALLVLPAVSGWLFHWPLYMPIRYFVKKKFETSDHYDSVLMAILLFAYPVYLLLLASLLFILFKNGWVWLTLIILPLTARSYVQLKGQLDW